MRIASNEPGKVGHVYEEECAYFIGYLAHTWEVDDPRISAAATDDQLWTFLLSDLFKFVIVDGFGFPGYAVGNDLVCLAREVQVMTVSKVSAMCEVQAKDGVSWLDDRAIGLHVGRGSGVRLHIGVLGAEELLGAIARKVFDDVGILATTVIALSGIAFGVLVREHRTHGFQHGFANEVFGGDQLQSFVLAAHF